MINSVLCISFAGVILRLWLVATVNAVKIGRAHPIFRIPSFLKIKGKLYHDESCLYDVGAERLRKDEKKLHLQCVNLSEFLLMGTYRLHYELQHNFKKRFSFSEWNRFFFEDCANSLIKQTVAQFGHGNEALITILWYGTFIIAGENPKCHRFILHLYFTLADRKDRWNITDWHWSLFHLTENFSHMCLLSHKQ